MTDVQVDIEPEITEEITDNLTVSDEAQHIGITDGAKRKLENLALAREKAKAAKIRKTEIARKEKEMREYADNEKERKVNELYQQMLKNKAPATHEELPVSQPKPRRVRTVVVEHSSDDDDSELVFIRKSKVKKEKQPEPQQPFLPEHMRSRMFGLPPRF